MTTKFNEATTGAFIHPDQARTVSLREAARLQSFPDDFIFQGSASQVRQQIGLIAANVFTRDDVDGLKAISLDQSPVDDKVVLDLIQKHQPDKPKQEKAPAAIPS